MDSREAAETFYVNGITSLRKRDYNSAVDWFTKAAEEGFVDAEFEVDVLLQRAYAHSRLAGKNNQNAAIADAYKVTQARPEEPVPWFLLGGLWLVQGEFDKAIDCLEKAVEHAPDDNLFKDKLRYARLVKSATVDYANFIEGRSEEVATLYSNGLNKLMQDSLDKAVADFDEIVQLEPNNPAAWGIRGFIHNRLGNRSEAIADCKMSLDLDPDFREAKTELKIAQVTK